jgi:invasion protein IalB
MARRPLTRCGISALAAIAKEWVRAPACQVRLDRSKAFDTPNRMTLAFRRKGCGSRMNPSILQRGPRTRALRGAGAVLAACLCFAFAPQALAQGVVKSKHGDWETRCETPPGAAHEQCALIQSVAAEDRPNVTLIVIVLKTADGKSRLLRVIAPLGVLIPSGLGLKIDQVDVGRAGFVRCLPNGCIAEVVMEDKLIDQMKSGQSATFIIFQTPEEGIGIPLALAGFKDAVEALP